MKCCLACSSPGVCLDHVAFPSLLSQALETKSAPPPSADPMAFAEEVDTDLGVSLARARRLVQMKDKARERKARDVGEVGEECVNR